MKVFNYISSQLKVKNFSIPALKHNSRNILINNDIEKANLFGNYFHSIFNKNIPPSLNSYHKNSSITKLSYVDISEIDVYETLTKLQSKQNTSPDGINN